ncbi:MAG: hypothetical protein ACI9V8_002011 [Urechidicola sp.]
MSRKKSLPLEMPNSFFCDEPPKQYSLTGYII